jgi:hypothetical protein
MLKRNMEPSLTEQEVKQRIVEIRMLDLKTVGVDMLREELRPLLRGYALSTPILAPPQRLYRGVTRQDKPQKVAEIGYPPAHKIRRFGRVNRPRQSRFYCSIGSPVTFFELGVKSGDYVALSQWKLREPLLVNNAGFSPSTFARLNSNRSDTPKWQIDEPVENTAAAQLVHEFFCEEFCQIVEDDADHKYKVSVAISELLLGPLAGDLSNIASVPNKRFAGIVYPSMAVKWNSDNLVLLTSTTSASSLPFCSRILR